IANVLWIQLRDRVSHLASFDKSDRYDNLPPATRPAFEERPPENRGGRGGARLGELADRAARLRQRAPEMLGNPTDQSIKLSEIASVTRELLKERKDSEPFVTGLMRLGEDKKPVTLVVIPPTTERRFTRVLVAVVPVERVEQRFAEARKG